MNKKVKIILLSTIAVGLAIGGYIAFKKIYTSGKLTANAKKDRKVFIKNEKK